MTTFLKSKDKHNLFGMLFHHHFCYTKKDDGITFRNAYANSYFLKK